MFNSEQLRLARQYLGLTLQEIAEALERSRQFISQLETGRVQPTAEIIDGLVRILDVDAQFFMRPRIGSIVEDQVHFRKRVSARVADRQTMLARGEFFGKVVDFIEGKLRFPAVNIPEISGATCDAESIERAAERCRDCWDLGRGPIANMTRVVENAGAVVTSFDDLSAKLDALSITRRRPVIIRNDAKQSPFRLCFDLAHELGHFVMHEGQVTGDRVTESQANRFASAFLLPRTTFAKSFPQRGSRIDWKGVSDLKMKWRVSKAALLYRARDLQLISDDTYRGAVIRLKNAGESIEESEDRLIQKEQPELLASALRGMETYHRITFEGLAKALNVHVRFLARTVKPLDEPNPIPPKVPYLRLVS